MNKIPLVRDTISKVELDLLSDWIKTYPRLTKGELTKQFEDEWSKWLGVKYSVFVNSGSSANLAIIYSLLLSKKMKNNKIIVPSISWVTTVSPIIQLGLKPILCECDKETLGLDIEDLETLFIKESPAAIMLVHVLGIPNKMNEIKALCEKYKVIILEDSCESVGSEYYGKKTGSFGLMSSFSFYFGHHISTIEGGMVCTNNKELYNILQSIRSHGWVRDVNEQTQNDWLENYNIDDFKKQYTFVYPGFNLRATDLQAYIGIEQIKKIDEISKIRNKNYNLYKKYIDHNMCKISEDENIFISNFAYPVISRNIKNIINNLKKNNIETRPLIAGNIGKQPFWSNLYGAQEFQYADIVDKLGIYLPNNHEITTEEVKFICNIINNSKGE
jgi:CDP-4-dehydro-6-deoxyglucose reductase, E1